MRQKVIIIDYGSQVTQLIARRIREAGVYSEIHSCAIGKEKLRELKPAAIVLSGGPASANSPDSPKLDPEILALGKPILAICYGMQLISLAFGGELTPASSREYGSALLEMSAPSPLWSGLARDIPARVWMSHGDTVSVVPEGFKVIGKTENVAVAAIANDERKIYATQFHPEVHHTADGARMIENFLFVVCGLKSDWNMANFVTRAIDEAKAKIGDSGVICAISGGVDSAVTAVLLNKAIGEKLRCVFVDNGLLRLNEAEEIRDLLGSRLKLNLTVIDAAETFLSRLAGVESPEEKRKIIGHTFIEIFEKEAKKFPDVKFLAQGTLYPDVIESVSPKGPSAVIKSHHNVGGLPETMNLELVEPLRELFKDEARRVGLELGLPESAVWRQPFPGPGLAIRIIGDVTSEKLEVLRKADWIIREEISAADLAREVWQAFAVLLPLRTVGVMGDARTYERVVALRCVNSVDAMTADWTRLPYDLLARISARIINETRGINRVVYDISSKPPATIEWE